MTQEQLKEKEAFRAIIKAVANFKVLKQDAVRITDNESNFLTEKLEQLDVEVKKEIEKELGMELQVDPNNFARPNMIRLDNLPMIPERFDEEDISPISNLRPRYGNNR